jgi:hypothetical protein
VHEAGWFYRLETSELNTRSLRGVFWKEDHKTFFEAAEAAEMPSEGWKSTYRFDGWIGHTRERKGLS